jgi:uncharacterized protein YbjQ (UPF0145 family)
LPVCSHCGKQYLFGLPDGWCVDCVERRHPFYKAREGIILTTSIDIPNRTIEKVISIVAAESALGMSILRDIVNERRNKVGGRAILSQKPLREARAACLDELRSEAFTLGADAVIAVDLNYTELSADGPGGILLVAATGTAVKLAVADGDGLNPSPIPLLSSERPSRASLNQVHEMEVELPKDAQA